MLLFNKLKLQDTSFRLGNFNFNLVTLLLFVWFIMRVGLLHCTHESKRDLFLFLIKNRSIFGAVTAN